MEDHDYTFFPYGLRNIVSPCLRAGVWQKKKKQQQQQQENVEVN